MIYGDRIKQARELNGLTQTELASQIGCKQSAIAHFENNITAPSTATLKEIARATGFLTSFFEEPALDDFSLGSLAYRSRRSATKQEQAQAYQYGSIMYEQTKQMSQKLDLPLLRLPRISERPELSAKVTRAALGLSPDTPIANLTNSFEQNGGFIFVTPFILSKIDAFSRWAKLDVERPLIIVTSGIPGDRLRYSLAHEIGHLVMHNAPRGNILAMEKEANIFASEFLMPAEVIRGEIPAPVTITSLMGLKQRWGVSIQSLIRRAYDLSLITERHYHYLFEQMSLKGWRKNEPIDIPIESPQAFSKMLKLSYPNDNDYALDMRLEPAKAREFVLYN
jgi:Zn-dependent peptidase ImmA (M78 family)/DNA-binding XRE family transcriptional regulator